jgi:hypothetical protein
MRYYEIIGESAERDVAMGGKAQRMASQVAERIRNGLKADAETRLFRDTVLMWRMETLGLTENESALSEWCLVLAPNQSRGGWAVTGATIRNEKAIVLDRYSQVVVIYGLREVNNFGGGILATEPTFVRVLAHEFLHMLDILRLDNIEVKPDPVGNYMDRIDPQRYFNKPLEYNARFHDLVSSLTSVGASAPEERLDLADEVGLTGDFKKDLEHLLKPQDRDGTDEFLKWLTEPRRKALLRRLYKLYQHVWALVVQAEVE